MSVYWPKKSPEPVAFVTLTVPVPLKVPPPIILPGAGINTPVTDIVPLTVILLLDVTPVLFAMVRLVNKVTFDGIITLTELPPNDKLEEEVKTKLAGLTIEGPFRLNVFEPTANVPEVRVRVPPTVKLPFKVTILLGAVPVLATVIFVAPVKVPTPTTLIDWLLLPLKLKLCVLEPEENKTAD